MQKIIILLVFCTAGVLLQSENLYSLDSGDSGETLFSINRIDNKNDTLTLQKLFILESELSESSYIRGDLLHTGFREYDGKWLPNEKNTEKPMYTFRTGFYIDESLKNNNLSIYMALTGYARNIYLNGIKILTIGKFKDEYNTSSFIAENIYLSNNLLHYGSEINEFAVQLYPHKGREALGKLVLSSYYKNSARVFMQNFMGLYLIRAGVVVSSVIFIYFLFLFFTMGLKNYSYLFFALTCLFFGLSYYNMILYFDGVSQILIEKISRCSFPWTVMFVSFFIMEFAGILNKNKWIKIGLSIPAAILCIITAMQKKLADIGAVFTITMFGYLAPLLIFSIIILFISLIKDKNKKVIIILFSFAAVILTALHDIYNVVSNILPYTYIMQFGFLSIVLSIFFLLAYDQSRIFIISLKTAKDLNIKNKSLNKMVEDIFSVSESVSTSSKKLENIVETSSGVIRQYEGNNKKIIATAINRLVDVENMIKKIGERIDTSTEKIPRALINQTSIVEEVSATITNMNTHMENTMVRSDKSNSAAQQLAELAEKSRNMILESKTAIGKISEYSQFLNEVFVAIENIADKTNILSINAAIEAARQGKNGRGFSVIAGEISTLSQKSKNTLESSFEKIKSMYEVIDKSTNISDEVSESLFAIIEKIKESSDMVRTITTLIQEQKSNLSEILISIENLLQDTFTIKTLSEEECRENEKIKETLSELKTTFSTITDLLKNQLAKGSELYSFIVKIKDITNENLQNVKILRKTTTLEHDMH